jgi:8-oxo-dGTP pyrophosphatase MutT (NUDIX family)
MSELRFEKRPGATAGAEVRLCCSVTIVDDQGRVLLQRRTDGDWWGLPGGRLDPGETFTGAARREVREETGLEIEIVRLTGAYASPDFCAIYPDGHRVQNAVLNFLARPSGGTLIAANGETAELRWFRPDDLPANLIPSHPSRIADALAHPPVLYVD